MREEFISHNRKQKDTGKNIEIEDKRHELVILFEKYGLPLNYELRGMLNEDREHQGGRRGCGFTQASRHLAAFTRKGRDKPPLSIFDEELVRKIENRLYEEGGYDLIEDTPIHTQIDFSKLNEVAKEVKDPGSKIIFNIISELCKENEPDESILKAPTQDEKIEKGTCTSAEIYFYEYLSPGNGWEANLQKGWAKINFVVDSSSRPVFIEKIGLGEDHSAISLIPLNVNDVTVPAGSLFVLKYEDSEDRQKTQSGYGSVINFNDLGAVEFLRFTPIIMSPDHREDVFGNHLRFQKDNFMYKPDELTVNDFSRRAQLETKKN